MAQQFDSRQPRRRRNGADEPYDVQGNLPSQPSERSAEVSQGADDSLANIDKALKEQEKSAGLYNAGGDSKGKSRGDLAKEEIKADGGGKSRGLGSVIGKKRGSFNISSRLKKRLAIAGGAAIISAIVSIITFFALLPLKIESIVNNLETRFTATSQEALGKETNRLFDDWMVKDVLPNVGKGVCHTTVDAGCVSVDKGTGPIHKMYEGWRQGHLEQKLATKYNLTFAKQGSVYYVNTEGRSIKIGNGTSIFGDANTSAGTRHEIEQVVSGRLKEGTLWDKLYFRFRVLPFLKTKYGLRYCLEKCKVINTFSDSVDIKKQAAKAWFVQRVISPMSATYGDIMQCLIIGADYCSTALDPANQGDTERSTAFQRQFSSTLDSLAARYAAENALPDLVEKAKTISDEGFTRFVVKEMLVKMATAFGGDAVAAAGVGDVAAKAIGPIGWTFFIAKMFTLAEHIGPTLKYMSYAANAAGAVAVYHMYSTATSEMKSGGIDATEIGSLNDALSTNMSGSKDDQVDATQTPLYNALNTPVYTPSQTALSGLLPGRAWAASTTNGGEEVYRCNDGTTVPKGKLVCPEEQLDRGNAVADQISSIVSQIPVLPQLAGLISGIGDRIGGLFGSIFMGVCKVTPGCSQALSYVTGLVQGAIQPLMDWLVNKLISSPITANMSGGRIYDMMAAGADVEGNAACLNQLGCKRISDQQALAIQNQTLMDQKAAFDQHSFFARMFDSNSPYSFTSRLALALPSNLGTAGRQFASSLLNNPFSTFGHAFASLFGGQPSFAAAGMNGDPFGVIQYGYGDSDIPAHPEQYWNANCASHYNEAANKLDITDWLNQQTQDTNTGEATTTKPNACMLILASLQSAGGAFDSSLIPPESTVSDDQSGTSTGNPITGGNGPAGDDYAQGCKPMQQKYGSTYLWCDGQCVDFVLFRLMEHVNANINVKPNGYQYASALGAKGYKVDHTPAPNAVVSWPRGGVPGPGGAASSSAGHAAMVAKVNPDGSIVVEEYNYTNPLHYDTRTIPASTASQLTYAHTEVDYK